MTIHDDLTVPQGADFTHEFPLLDGRGQPRPVTGWSARAAIRQSPESDLLIVPVVQLRPGRVLLKLPGADTLEWSFRQARYEVMLFGPRGQRERHAAGRVLVDRTLVR